ncbi:hypothetical protein [Mycobacterium sp. 1245805.9]|uniref:hypothetical protein n=1 Tax=Mycobacterium sp. 1245805.9 TaxID=1856862 RepID=UPI0012EA4B75|nr:hypothetical protein [Mycobacterium sp. 1245805.9]
MSSFVRFGDEEIDLSAVSPAQMAALWRLYEDRRSYRNGRRMPLRCVKPHGGRMYLKVRGNQLWVAHYPGEGDPSCSMRVQPESVTHQRMREYSARAVETAGHTATPEYVAGRTRLDLLVQGPQTYGVEIQVSPLTVREAKRRTTLSHRAGATPLWLPNTYAPWEDKVPTLRPTTRSNSGGIDWEETLPKAMTVATPSIRRIVAGACTPTGPFDHCLNKPGGFCYDWHPDYELVIGVTLDDALVGTAEGFYVFHQTLRGHPLIVEAEGLRVFRDLTGHDGAFNPGIKVNPPQPAEEPRECIATRPLVDPASEVTPDPCELPPVRWINCRKCKQQTAVIGDEDRDICRRCEIHPPKRDMDVADSQLIGGAG